MTLLEIIKGGWDFVVLQQGPSASREGRELLLEYSRRFADEVRQRGDRVALYSVWPSASRRQVFKGVSASYSAKREETKLKRLAHLVENFAQGEEHRRA